VGIWSFLDLQNFDPTIPSCYDLFHC